MTAQWSRLSWTELKVLSLAISIGICGAMGIDIHLASLPYIMRYMHTTETRMQQSIAVYLLGSGASLLIYGPLSDKLGRKPVIIWGLSLACVGSLCSVFTKHVDAFLFTRLLQGLGAGACIGVGRTIITDVLQGERLSVIGSYFGMFFAISPIVAPALGGYIQHWVGWQMNFIVLAVVLLSVLLFYLFTCPETNQHINPNAFKFNTLMSNYFTILKNKEFDLYVALSGLAASIVIAYATTSTFIFQQQFHLSPIEYGWLSLVIGGSGIVGKFINAKIVMRIGMEKTLWVGVSCPVLGGLLLMLLIYFNGLTVATIMATVVIALMGQNLIVTNALPGAIKHFPKMKGAAGALYGSGQLTTTFTSSAIIAFFAAYGMLTLAIGYVVIGLLAIFVFASIQSLEDKTTR